MLIQFHLCSAKIPNGFSDYLKSFEIAECEIVRSENKRSLIKNNGTPHNDEVEVLLKSSNKTFRLLLFEDELFNEVLSQTRLYSKNSSSDFRNNANKYSNTKFYEGIVKDKPRQTSVIGYLHHGIFSGTILYENTEYFVEPLKFLIPSSPFSLKVAIYKIEDINLTNTNATEPFLDWSLAFRISNITVNVSREGISLDNITDDLSCDIEIVADHTLYQYFRKNTDKLSAYLYTHAKHADKIFRKSDFTMSGKPDGIRIKVAKISIYKTANDLNYPMVSANSVSEYLTEFIKRKQESQYCLSISLSYRPFVGSAIGESFIPDVSYRNLAGGICEPTIFDADQNSMNFNIATINVRHGQRPLLPLPISLLAFVHEIGHGFGSDHDNPNNKPCSPDSSKGKYLMHPKTLPLLEQRAEFSPCSRIAIREVLRKRGGCLKPVVATCGNAIREGAEECDCGWASICNLVDSCCNPSDIEFPAVGCTLKGSGSKCSPKESDCCTDDCATVCAIKDLEECECRDNLLEECLICCKTSTGCVPASELGILNPAGGKYMRKMGSRCNYGIYHCDATGICGEHRSVLSEPQHSKRNTSLIIFLSVLFYYCDYIFSRWLTLELLGTTKDDTTARLTFSTQIPSGVNRFHRLQQCAQGTMQTLQYPNSCLMMCHMLPKLSKCARCMTRVPYGTLIATIFCCAGVLTFLICLYRAVRLTLRMFDDVFKYNLEWLSSVQLAFIIVGSFMGLLAVTLLIVGICSTGATRSKVYRGWKSRVGGRISTALCMVIVYILNLAWLGIACCLVVVVFTFHVARQLCDNSTGCIDLQQFHFLFPNGTDLKLLNICSRKAFCTDAVVYAEPYYILSFVASIVVIISLLHYIMCLAANYTRIKDQENSKTCKSFNICKIPKWGHCQKTDSRT
ncbi:disintegrin and metalloproteinase domain-containing protein 10 [Caerostris extrusa]|uniref:Disintegrin and metalloproteinase domain-containing protein 10 n=1 Tax=Caerostris extrusa TaxID=172846 RepID=A0AAV4X577_CAEEX|nr:disintegrin and metalloproteinase domain-containing protein 10 [Caerostris extrusa]